MEHTNPLHRCPDRQCDDVAALLATAALGGDLNLEEQAQMLSYISTCANCRLRLDRFAGVAQALPLAVAEAEPPPNLRARIISAAAVGLPQPQLQRRTRRDWRTVLTGALAAAALVLAVLAGQQYRANQQQQAQTARNRAVVIAAFGNADSHEARFISAASAPEAAGRVLISPSEPAVVVYAKQLPLLKTGRVYQVWLQGNDRVIGIGSFVPDANNRVWALLRPEAPLPMPIAIFVTDEPASGSARPSSPILLQARFP